MAQINLTQGAKLAGVSRSTLNRHLKNGILSKGVGIDGKPCVETSELQRIYGALSQSKTPRDVSLIHHGTPHGTPTDTPDFKALQVELEQVKERLDEMRQDRDEWKGQARTLSTLLTDQRLPGGQANTAKRWWWSLFR